MNEIIRCMLERRSIRKYKPEQIPDEELNAVLEAGLYAPSAGGRQSPLIVVCQNAETNAALGKINKAAFRGRMSTGNVYVSKDQPSIADDAGIASGFYGAPTVITLFAPGNFLYSEADCCMAAQNIMLAAHSLRIGSCMIARARDTFSSELGRQLMEEWGIGKETEAKFHVVLGYADGVRPSPKPRKEGRIKRVL
ncbi:MAG: nitroreductase family protein [Syntrophomonadaceae bacterium]|jgi:nitroreductase|nr:nitroreductase family protein [Syntrophomonadaceae bacterium]